MSSLNIGVVCKTISWIKKTDNIDLQPMTNRNLILKFMTTLCNHNMNYEYILVTSLPDKFSIIVAGNVQACKDDDGGH